MLKLICVLVDGKVGKVPFLVVYSEFATMEEFWRAEIHQIGWADELTIHALKLVFRKPGRMTLFTRSRPSVAVMLGRRRRIVS